MARESEILTLDKCIGAITSMTARKVRDDGILIAASICILADEVAKLREELERQYDDRLDRERERRGE